ncbi:MAG: saccharopine dehydrogenase NADP-binding domain-containing protein [Pseudomonadota bacterium]
MTRILILGGYGNFGRFIAERLTIEEDFELTIAGRSKEKAEALALRLNASGYVIDTENNLEESLQAVNPDIVIHTCGPFQGQSYRVAEAVIASGAHYIDLADGAAFVAGFAVLNDLARRANVIAISGASSVPAFSSAVIEHYRAQFSELTAIDYSITTAQKATPGLATAAAVFSYVGKSFETINRGEAQPIYGWQGLRAKKYRGLGWRLLGNCDIPDLALFPNVYSNLQSIRFQAGLENPIIHLGLWALSWGVRVGLIENLPAAAPMLLRMSHLFDWMGTSNSGFHMHLTGANKIGATIDRDFQILAQDGDGSYIPCIPAILLARKIANGEIHETGAHACVGVLTLEEFFVEFRHLNIQWFEH